MEMIGHYESTEAARADVEPLLPAWEIDSGLNLMSKQFSFVFSRADVIDRNPVPGRAEMIGTASVPQSAVGSFTVTRRAYPGPPADFTLSPDVETMWNRYLGCQQGREPLPAMAYLCLTVLEASSGGRKGAAAQYFVDDKVLK